MEWRRRKGYLAMLLVAAVALSWVILRDTSPRYQGKPLSFWLGQPSQRPFPLVMQPGGERRQPGWYRARRESFRQDPVYIDYLEENASNALNAAGTDAVPCLVDLLAARDSKLKLQWRALVEKQHVIKLNPHVPAELLNLRAEH